MLCLKYSKPSTFQSALDLLEQELSKIEKPLLEILMSSRQLEKYASIHAYSEYYTSNIEPEARRIRVSELFDKGTVAKAFEELTPRQLECLTLLYWKNYSQYEIARKLGISRTTVAEHIEAAQTILRKYLINSLKTPVQEPLYI